MEAQVRMKPAPKVVRVTAREFELEDGRVFEHPVELDTPLPTPQEFQRIYDSVVERLQADDWLGLDTESR